MGVQSSCEFVWSLDPPSYKHMPKWHRAWNVAPAYLSSIALAQKVVCNVMC